MEQTFDPAVIGFGKGGKTFAQTMRAGVTVSELRDGTSPHPSMTEACNGLFANLA